MRFVAAMALAVILVASAAGCVGASGPLVVRDDARYQVPYDEPPTLLTGGSIVVVPDSLILKATDLVIHAHASIDTSGRLTNAQIFRCDPLFVDFVREHLLAHRFAPARLEGRAVSVETWGFRFQVRPQTPGRLIRSDLAVWGVEPNADGVAQVTDATAKQFALRVAEALCLQRLGEEFYHEHVGSDTSHRRMLWQQHGLEPGVCRVSLAMDTPAGAMNPEIWLHVLVESDGRAVPEYGVPDCIADPGECEFAITSERAITVAGSAGLQGDPSEWRVSFVWVPVRDQPTYAWRVSHVRSSAPPSAKARDSFVIDANDGKVDAPELRLHYSE